jgi:hypothetical protein
MRTFRRFWVQFCAVAVLGGFAPLRAAVAVTQDKPLWYLCDETAPDAPNEVTLTITGAEASKRFIWQITSGADLVHFPQSALGDKIISQTDNVKLKSKKGSAAKEDVKIKVIYRNTDFVEHKLTVLRPHSLHAGAVTHAPARIVANACTRGAAGDTEGFSSYINYQIRDQFADNTPNVRINEQFGR